MTGTVARISHPKYNHLLPAKAMLSQIRTLWTQAAFLATKMSGLAKTNNKSKKKQKIARYSSIWSETGGTGS